MNVYWECRLTLVDAELEVLDILDDEAEHLFFPFPPAPTPTGSSSELLVALCCCNKLSWSCDVSSVGNFFSASILICITKINRFLRHLCFVARDNQYR